MQTIDEQYRKLMQRDKPKDHVILAKYLELLAHRLKIVRKLMNSKIADDLNYWISSYQVYFKHNNWIEFKKDEIKRLIQHNMARRSIYQPIKGYHQFQRKISNEIYKRKVHENEPLVVNDDKVLLQMLIRFLFH